MSKNERKSLFRRMLFFLRFLEIRLRFVFILLVTALLVGYWDNVQNYYERWERARMAKIMERGAGAAKEEAPTQAFEYFCPMHTFVIREHPGKCPICGMDLVQRKKGAPVELPAGALSRVQVSPERIAQAGVQMEPVLYRLLSRKIQSYGVVEADETRIARITARFPGRVDELNVNAVGLAVKKGEPLARIYSPKFLAATEEYVQAVAAQKRSEGDSRATADERKRARELTGYARQRLELAGYTEEQLTMIARMAHAENRVTLHSPLAGIVLEKNVLLGDMVEEQTNLYTIADLSTLWIQALVVERDLDAIKVGMPVEVTSVAMPGHVFYGTVDFVYPTINPENRSGKVRVVVNNKDGSLKPGMYVTTTISSPLGQYSEVSAKEKAQSVKAAIALKLPTQTQEDAARYLDSLPAGAEFYRCPMDLEVVSDKREECPKCGMKLKKTTKKSAAAPSGEIPSAETGATVQWVEGYACPMHLGQLVSRPGICGVDDCGMQMKHWRIERVLSVPESAVIDTGTRYIIYVEALPGVYDAHEVKLGARAGAYYPVLSGLTLNQRIVSRGSFLIDAESRLNPSTVEGTTSATAPTEAASTMPSMPGMGH